MNFENEPKHIAIIMDGNGRWAKSRGRERVFGHIKGARVAKKIVEHCSKRNLEALTLYAFSDENWGRPVEEVSFLMRLLSRYIIRERASLVKNNIRFRCIGQLDKIPASVRKEVEKSIEMTSKNTGMSLTFALSYGGRQEILGAAQKVARLVENGDLKASDIDEETFGRFLQTHPLRDPDLMIRTSGEYRLSNFLPWQSVYSELYFTKVLWPDFTEKDLDLAIAYFSQRERRFGKTSEQCFVSELQ